MDSDRLNPYLFSVWVSKNTVICQKPRTVNLYYNILIAIFAPKPVILMTTIY